jgi:hypothetical protein
MIESEAEPAATTLREFWQSTRQLQRSWDSTLEGGLNTPEDLTRFEQVLARLLTTELLARVWATVLGSIDQRTGKNDLTRIATNAVSGLLQFRHRILSRLVSDAAVASNWAADQDRLRRRCDRWTDLLIGNLCGHDEFFQFAINPERARDFAEEAREGDSSSRPVGLLVAAGLRLSFLGLLPEVSLDSPAFEELIQSILGAIPELAFQRDGLMRHQEWSDPISTKSTDQILIPGMNLAKLRERFC